MRQKDEENFLDYIPEHLPQRPWREEKGRIIVEVLNKTPCDKLAQRFFKKPPSTQAELDELGSFVWRNIDGRRTVLALSELVKSEFGEAAEPLYARLSAFFAILKGYGLIRFKGKICA